MAEPPIRIGGSPHHVKLTAVATVCSGTRVAQKRSPAEAGPLFAAKKPTSAPDFLAHRIAGGVAHATALAHRRAPLLDHDFVALARLRCSCTDGAADPCTNRRADRPTDR